MPGGEGLAERAAERAAGRRCARMSSGQGGRVSVDGREGSSGVVSLLCVREEGKVPVPVLCLCCAWKER